MIQLTDIIKSHGVRTLFRDVTLQLHGGHRYGIAGANGAGKSTLLRLMSGEEEPTSGTIAIPGRVRVGVLDQDHFKYEDERILDVVMMGDRVLWDAMVEKEEVLARAHESFDADRYTELEDIVLAGGGYELEARAGEILEGLNIPTAVHLEPLSVLSGGFKLRVLLAQTLAAKPDLLLLDEPTNHLDILSIRWLEKFLLSFDGCAVVVSHDRRFLNAICTDILDVDYERVIHYRGDYDSFEAQKVGDRERKEAQIAKQEEEKVRHERFIERFKAKATKARQAQSRVKQLERMEFEELPQSSRQYPNFRFSACRPPGKAVVEAEGISKAYGEKRVLQDVSVEVLRDDRLAIIGPNGIGKSTLLKILMGKVAADAGQVRWGHETHPGYFSQDHHELEASAEQSLLDWLWTSCGDQNQGFVRGKLAEVLFSKDDVFKKIGNLSGGEAARLVFCGLGVNKPNVLILDEPTNHLDIEGIEALAQGLEAYDGTIVFVSHDRWFVSRLANRILEITPEGIEDFRGSYGEYLQKCGDDHLDTQAVVERAQQARRR